MTIFARRFICLSQAGVNGMGGGGAVVLQLTGDSGIATAVANNINVLGNGAAAPASLANSGMFYTGTPGNLQTTIRYLNMPKTTAAGLGILYANSVRFMHNYTGVAGFNTFLGEFSGNLTMTNAINNCMIGLAAGLSLTLGSRNSTVGQSSMQLATDAVDCSALGWNALHSLTTGPYNTAVGSGALSSLTTGLGNTAIGMDAAASAGINLTSNENYNLLLNNQGVTGESNAIRIGNAQNNFSAGGKTYIKGIYGNTLASNNTYSLVAVNGTNDQIGYLGLATNGQIPIGSTNAAMVLNTITAGSGITVTNGAGTITISSSGADLLAYTNVNTTPYVVLTGDEFLGVDCSGAAITIQLPDAPSTGRVYIIKDRTGSANTNAITVTTVGGAVNIDGATSYTMNTQYASIQLLFDGSTYQIY